MFCKLNRPSEAENANLLYALGENCHIGTVRECFVINQLNAKHNSEYGKAAGDFKIDGKITFEVAGEKKSFDQIANIPDSYILADNLEFPIGNKLPVWTVGLIS